VIIKFQLSTLAREINNNGQPLVSALGILARAYRYAQDTNVDLWEYATPISEFRYVGVTVNELRWLLFSGLAVHAKEVSDPTGQARGRMSPV